MNLSTGTKIRWESAAGVLRGTIKNIDLSPNANGEIIPWINVECEVNKRYGSHDATVRMCATDSYMKMMRVALVA